MYRLRKIDGFRIYEGKHILTIHITWTLYKHFYLDTMPAKLDLPICFNLGQNILGIFSKTIPQEDKTQPQYAWRCLSILAADFFQCHSFRKDSAGSIPLIRLPLTSPAQMKDLSQIFEANWRRDYRKSHDFSRGLGDYFVCIDVNVCKERPGSLYICGKYVCRLQTAEQ